MTIIVLLLLVSLMLLSISLQRTYQQIPLLELKRRARKGDHIAELLYRAASYGGSLRIVLWFFVGMTGSGFFLVLARSVPTFFAFVLCALVIWLGFIWLPAGKVTKIGERAATIVAPLLAWLLSYLHPLLDRLLVFVRRHRPVTVHTGLYEKSDLVDLLQRQQVAPNNRIEKAELEMALHALTFGDQLVRNQLIPRRVVKMVSVSDKIGPVLMDELHASGHSRFPVYEDDQGNIVGTLYLRDLIQQHTGGEVRSAMRADACYVHEDQPLLDALQAVLKTHHHLLIVVNSFEEFVGIITAEDVIEQIIGKQIVDEFDRHDDMRAVASTFAKAEHEAHLDKTTPEVVE